MIEGLAAVGVKGINSIAMLLDDAWQRSKMGRVARALFGPKRTVFEDRCETSSYYNMSRGALPEAQFFGFPVHGSI